MIDENMNCVGLKRDYHAVGNGLSDDTVFVRSFFDYLAENGGVGIIEPVVYLTKQYNRLGNAKPFSVIGSGY